MPNLESQAREDRQGDEDREAGPGNSKSRTDPPNAGPFGRRASAAFDKTTLMAAAPNQGVAAATPGSRPETAKCALPPSRPRCALRIRSPFSRSALASSAIPKDRVTAPTNYKAIVRVYDTGDFTSNSELSIARSALPGPGRRFQKRGRFPVGRAGPAPRYRAGSLFPIGAGLLASEHASVPTWIVRPVADDVKRGGRLTARRPNGDFDAGYSALSSGIGAP